MSRSISSSSSSIIMLTVALVVLVSLFSVAQSGACCGDSRCDWPAEDCRSCPSDCGACPTCNLCGNRVCDAGKGENACNCPLDCGPCCPDGVCREDRNETAFNCPSDCALTIRLLVVDAVTGAHLPGASVRCAYNYAGMMANYGPVVTNSDGRTSFSGVAGGDYVCTGELPPTYNPGYVKFTVYPLTTPQEYVIPLTPNPACLMGTVYDAVTLEPLDNATVYCVNSAANYTTYTVIASVMGYYYYSPVPPGTYRCYASRPSYSPNSNNGYLPPAGMANIDIYLNPLPGGIIGTVYNLANNSVIPNAQIVCTSDTTQSLPQQTTNNNGFYYVPNVNAARVVCTASVPDFYPDTRTGVVVNGFNTTINFYLNELPGSLQVTVVENGTNVPIAMASVTCTASTLTLTTPANGSVLYTPVSPGTGYSCYASAAGYSSGSLSGIVVVRNRLTAVVIPLNPLPAILTVVTVDNSTKFLLPGAAVTVTPGNYAGLTVGGSASIMFTVPAGTYSATATKQNYSPGSNNSFTVTKGQSLTVYVYLNPLPGQLIVIVIADDTKQPLPGATVNVQGPSGNAFVSGATTPSPDATLRYVISDYGFYRASASATGYSSDSRQSDTAVLANTTVTITLVLKPLPNQLTVLVRDATTFALIPGASVTLNPTGAQATATAGTTVFTNLAAGQYTATASAQFYSTNTSTPAVTMVRNESRETTVYLSQLSCNLVVTVLNADTGAVITGASVSLDNTFYTVQTTNPTATFTVFSSKATSLASATATGFLGTGNATFTCPPGSTTPVNITLKPVITVTLVLQTVNVPPAQIPTATATLNGTTTLTATNSTSSTYVFTVPFLPYYAIVNASAPGFVSVLRPVNWTTIRRVQTISLSPQPFNIYFTIYESLDNGKDNLFRGNSSFGNNLLNFFQQDVGFTPNQGYYQPAQFNFAGSVTRYDNASYSSVAIITSQYSTEASLAQQATFEPLLQAVLDGSTDPELTGNSVPSNLTILAATFTSIPPTSQGAFYGVVQDFTGFTANFDSTVVSGGSFLVNVPEYNSTLIRNLLIPLPYARAFGYLDIKFVPYLNDGTTKSTFAANNFISVTFITNLQTYFASTSSTGSNSLANAQFAILEIPLVFNEQVTAINVAYQTEEFDVTKSGWLSGSTVTVGQNVTVPGVTQFTFPPQSLLDNLFTTVGSQKLRDVNARLYVLEEYRLFRKAKKRMIN